MESCLRDDCDGKLSPVPNTKVRLPERIGDIVPGNPHPPAKREGEGKTGLVYCDTCRITFYPKEAEKGKEEQ